jgi:hypothetical protein
VTVDAKFSLPILPGNLRSSQVLHDFHIAIQVREVPSTDGPTYLVGIAHGTWGGAERDSWDNRYLSASSDQAHNLADSLHDEETDNWAELVADTANRLGSAKYGELVDCLNAYPYGNKGTKQTILAEAVELHNMTISDEADNLANDLI